MNQLDMAINPELIRSSMGVAGDRIRWAFSHLVEHYRANGSFMNDFSELVDRHSRMFECIGLKGGVEGSVGDIPFGLGPLGLPNWWNEVLNSGRSVRKGDPHDLDSSRRSAERSPAKQLQEAVCEIKAMADRWGLRAPWGPALILQNAVMGTLFSPPTFRSWEVWSRSLPQKKVDLKDIMRVFPGIIRETEESSETEETPQTAFVDCRLIILVEHYDPMLQSDKQFLDVVRQKAESQMKSVKEILVGAGMELLPKKSSLDAHVRWLYLHICPQPDWGRPYGWREIATREHYNIGVITRPVKALARDLNISLPKLPAGRPRKFP